MKSTYLFTLLVAASILEVSFGQSTTCSVSCSCTVNGVVTPGVVTQTENGCTCTCNGGSGGGSSGGSGSGGQDRIRELCEQGRLSAFICERFGFGGQLSIQSDNEGHDNGQEVVQLVAEIISSLIKLDKLEG